MREIVLEADRSCVGKARAFVTSFLEDEGVQELEAFDVLLALNEAVANALRHAYDNVTQPLLTVSCRNEDQTLLLEVIDNGHGFDYHPSMKELPDPLSGSGRGFFLMNELMDDVSVESSSRGTIVGLNRVLIGSTLASR